MIAEIEAKVLGIHKTESEQPYVALKYFQPSFECFSDWDKDDLKGFLISTDLPLTATKPRDACLS